MSAEKSERKGDQTAKKDRQPSAHEIDETILPTISDIVKNNPILLERVMRIIEKTMQSRLEKKEKEGK